MDSPLVVKVGGSLWDWIPGLITIFRQSPRSLLIIPGGGPFANFIRSLHLSDDVSHWMAVAAMDQFGWYISSFGIQPIDALSMSVETKVLLPYKLMRKNDPLPHSWTVTSDTIAAWVASQLNLDLLLLKSIDGICMKEKLVERLESPIECSEVDPAFLPFVYSHHVQCIIMNGRVIKRVLRFLKGNSVLGTVIDTRF